MAVKKAIPLFFRSGFRLEPKVNISRKGAVELPAYPWFNGINGGAAMKINRLIPDLIVKDVNSHIRLYKEDFGFDVVSQYPRWGNLQWALMENKQRDMQVMFEKETAIMEEIAGLENKAAGGKLTYYAEVDDIDGVYEKIKERMKVVTDIYATSYGMDEFVAQDREGYVIVFGERMSGSGDWECF